MAVAAAGSALNWCGVAFPGLLATTQCCQCPPGPMTEGGAVIVCTTIACLKSYMYIDIASPTAIVTISHPLMFSNVRQRPASP